MDAKVLEVAKVDIVRNDDSVVVRGWPAILRRVPPVMDVSRQIASRITRKAKRLQASSAAVSHTNLVIEDRSRLHSSVLKRNCFHRIFTPALVEAIRKSPFREIVLVTHIENECVYVPLNMLYLMSEWYYFDAVVSALGGRAIHAGVDVQEAFAAYLSDNVATQVVVRRSGGATEVIFGDSGLLVAECGAVTVRRYCDRPFGSGTSEPLVNWRVVFGEQFQDELAKFRQANTFSTDLAFPVTTNASK